MAGFWESCLLRFEQELPAQQFNTWIKPLRLQGEAAPLDGLRLIAPNSFILKWVRDRYLTRIEEYAGAFFSGPISNFINRHPSIKMLALSFLILIGCMLVAEGTGQHINKGYIYFAMFFSLTVESLNLVTMRKKRAKRDARRQTLAPEQA